MTVTSPNMQLVHLSFVTRKHLLLPGESVDSALDKNKSELSVLVLPVPLKMLPDGHGLLDQIVAVLGELWGHTLALEDAEDLVASDESHLKKREVQERAK